MTQDEKINYMRIAAGIVGYKFDDKSLYLLICLYDLTLEKEGSATLKDVCTIESLVNEKYKTAEQ